MSDQENDSNQRNISEYEYISDLTAIAGQEKTSFDSVVNWTLMVATAGLLCIATLWSRQLPQKGLFLQLVLLIFMFVISMFARRAWRGYENYYEYCNARRRILKNKGFEFDKDDKRGKCLREQTLWGFFLTTEFLYIFLIQIVLYLYLIRGNWCLLIVTLLACVCYWSINCIIPKKLPKEQDP